MKQHEFRELVNELRDTAIKYHAHQDLRERIVHVLRASSDVNVSIHSHGEVLLHGGRTERIQ